MLLNCFSKSYEELHSLLDELIILNVKKCITNILKEKSDEEE